MKKNIGTCGLCKKEKVELQDSHIIPKLAYKRVKAYSTSRFRNYYDINTIYQDGEKKPLLCSDCELFFSKYETHFANKYFDKFLQSKSKLPKSHSEMDTYLFSVSWRILYDDLYILNSFDGEYSRTIFEDFEKKLFSYLEELRLGNTPAYPHYIKNYIFSIRHFGFSNEINELLKPSLFGYSFNSSDHSKYIVFSHYAGLVTATVYRPENVMVLDKKLRAYFIDKFTSRIVKKLLEEEIIYQLKMMIEQKSVNDKVLDAGLREKLIVRYKNVKR